MLIDAPFNHRIEGIAKTCIALARMVFGTGKGATALYQKGPVSCSFGIADGNRHRLVAFWTVITPLTKMVFAQASLLLPCLKVTPDRKTFFYLFVRLR